MIPLYKQIYEQIRSQILAGDMLYGQRLPTERDLAKSLSISRTTVLNAYQELKDDGLLLSKPRQGTIVAGPVRTLRNILGSCQPNWYQMIKKEVANMQEVNENEIIEIINRRDLISFTGGRMSYSCNRQSSMPLPQDMEFDMAEHPQDVCVTSPAEGLPSFRKAILDRNPYRNGLCHEKNMVITRGARHGLTLVAQALINPGDIVLVEEPTYPAVIHQFRNAGARVMGIEMTPHGMDLDMLSETLKRYRVKLIVTMPNVHNPTGITTSIKHRHRLLEITYKHNTIVVEDDPFCGVPYDKAHPVPTLKSLDYRGYVIFIGTFSKLVSPRLETGWICADEKFIEVIKRAMRAMTIFSNTPTQLMIQRYIENGKLDDHIERIRMIDQRHDALFEQVFWEWIGSRSPAGVFGPFRIIFLPTDVSATALVKHAATKGIAVLPGTFFSLDREAGERFVRVELRQVPTGNMMPGLQILQEAITELEMIQRQRTPLFMVETSV